MTPKKLPSGSWQIRWRDAGGRQRAQNFAYKADAVAAENTILADLQKGLHIPPSAGRITLDDWADQWLAGARRLGQGGRDTYRRDLDRYILPVLGGHKLRNITDKTIDEYLSAKLEDGLAASTVHRHYRTLRRCLQVAVDRQMLARNPCDPVEPPTVKATEMRFLTVAEIDTLVEAMPDRYKALVLVATYGGPRWSELVGLQRRSIDDGRVTIADQLIRRSDGQWHRDKPKTRAGVRTITLPTSVATALGQHIDAYALPGPDGLVFPNSHGRPLNGPSFRSNVWAQACARAGLGEVVKVKGARPKYVGCPRIHDMRHTAVALAIAVGAHPKAIQARMGHASITTTLDRYGHLYPEMDETIAVDLERLRGS